MRIAMAIESILTALCLLRLKFPISIGLIDNNLFFYFMKGVGTNFVFVWMILLAVLLIIHIVGIRQKRELSDIKTDAVCVIGAVVALVVSIL